MAGDQHRREEDRDPDDEFEVPPQKPWSSTTQVVAAVAWSSFLGACVATMLFFAFIDPGLIHEATTIRVEITRMTGYGVGFFFFWLICAIAAGVAVYLVRTAHIPERDADSRNE